MKKNKPLTRRDFIKKTSLAAAGGAVFLAQPEWARLKAESTSKTAGKVKVVLVRNKDVLDENGRPVYDVVQEMLDAAVTELTGRPDPVAAWKSLIKPDDVVGIKSNVWRFIPTTPPVEKALKKRVLDAGVDESNIAVSDRGVLKDPVFQKSTALINARPMRSHHWSGVGSLIKNYIMFVPAPWDYHDDSCARLATIWDNPLVKGKTRLNVLVMLTPQFHGVGPHNFNPKYVWSYRGFIVSFDPVAADSVGLRIIQAKRQEFF
ncbi:MAG: twin-arginine translocation signal domain-containing protein, partial [Candidatus Aminicenantes bacterium]|nr:twin-arginine translocation signal domain-containing protein [Candidatus Aminicenantes bacterium]